MLDETRIQTVLQELEQFGQQNDANQSDRRLRMLNLEPETAALVDILVRVGRCKRLLEIGTSNGYSTIWLARACYAQDGKITSIDREPEKHDMARANLERVGLLDRVKLLTGDATEIITGLLGPFDFVLFDADRHSAPEQLELLLPMLDHRALILADNVNSHPDQIAGYMEAIQSVPGVVHMVAPVGKGLSIAYLR